MRAPMFGIPAWAVGFAVISHGMAYAQNVGVDNTAHAGSNTPAFNFHGQSTFIGQGAAPFRSPYEGENSLDPDGEARETWTVTLAAGLRLAEGSELYVNPELFQGFGLSSTHGVAGFVNGEAQKGGTEAPVGYIARLFFRQTFGFGGEQEDVKDEFNQLGGKRDISRATVTVGKLSVTDLFDDNTYAHDPRTTFFNWSLWEAGGFDYAADLKGYTYGIALDFNRKDWALRFGYFLVPVKSNVEKLDWDIFARGQYVAELEQRYNLFSQPGKLRWLGWLSRANAGNYDESLALSESTGADPNDTIVETRHTRTKFGFVIGAEQSLSDTLGIFARLSWSDGRSEIMSFTDIDSSASIGLRLKGEAWGRPNDVIGIGGAINAISEPHREWIGAGGLGLLIGDGKLNYSEERIFETYYMLPLCDPVSLTLDYQFIDNPGYNADRGPVSVFAARLHGQF
ncbi:carbohydrate porin [Hyphomicrobium sp.]|uniref:carbohydrate porin n=1 Tax=Hyphomicrobium sp. TaxID=82 RepID=UPI002E34C202|nr:carbohydrate porin [Hyphomicrobium sp.]HEX2843146.1 carbohydrate porin [Hyphomicrobium sp.]